MKQHPRFQITSKQLVFLIIGAIIGTGVFDLPRTASAVAAQDAWISVLLGGLAPLLALFLIERLGRKFPDLTIVELVQHLFGKVAGAVLAVSFIIYAFFFQSVVLRRFINITALYMLPKTPLWAIGLIMMIAVVYAASKGAKVLGRLNELIFYLVFIDLLIIMIPLVRADITSILPVGSVGLPAILKGGLVTAFTYSGAEALFVVYPMVGRKDEVLKAGILGVGFVMLAYFVLTVVSLLVLGVEINQRLIIPVFTLLKVVDIVVIERLELFSTILFLGLGPRPVFNFTFAASFSLTQLLGLDIDRHYPIVVIGVGLLVYILALLPHDYIQIGKLENYVGYASLVIGIGYPVIFHIAAHLKRGRASNG